MRVAFTIIYNGLHHLQHKNYVESLLPFIDLWVFVDGLAGNGGSTSWCRDLKGCSSEDGTVEYLRELQENNKNLVLVECKKKWRSKDAMVNRAIEEIKKVTNKAFLWEIDADEQWKEFTMTLAEYSLQDQGGKVGLFHSNYYVGKNILAYGMWGEGIGLPYKRLWDWNGEYFLKHEPPTLMGGGKEVLMNVRFDHYAWYFEQDVIFKSKYYGGHENAHKGWLALNGGKIRLPADVSDLFGHNRGYFKNTKLRAV